MKCITFKNANMCKLMNAVFDIVTHKERLSGKLIYTDEVSYSFMTKKGIYTITKGINNCANVRYKWLPSWETLNFIDLASKINIDIYRENFSYTFIWGGYKRPFNDSTELNNYILYTLNEIKKITGN